jgi:hypothetical protein
MMTISDGASAGRFYSQSKGHECLSQSDTGLVRRAAHLTVRPIGISAHASLDKLSVVWLARRLLWLDFPIRSLMIIGEISMKRALVPNLRSNAANLASR